MIHIKKGTKTVLELAHDVQAIADAGLLHAGNRFDVAHFTRVREIAAQLMGSDIALPAADANNLFEQDDGYQTPKVVTSAAIFNDRNEVLLIRDYDGKWNLPGGWCDFDCSIASSTVKEAKEEAGLDVVPGRLVCIHDDRLRNGSNACYPCLQYIILCRVTGGYFVPNDETTESGYFPLNALPELNLRKTTPEQLALCLQAKLAEHWETEYD